MLLVRADNEALAMCELIKSTRHSSKQATTRHSRGSSSHCQNEIKKRKRVHESMCVYVFVYMYNSKHIVRLFFFV